MCGDVIFRSSDESYFSYFKYIKMPKVESAKPYQDNKE